MKVMDRVRDIFKVVLISVVMNGLFWQPVQAFADVMDNSDNSYPVVINWSKTAVQHSSKEYVIEDRISGVISPGQTSRIVFGDVVLSIPAGAVKTETEIEILKLAGCEELDPGMVNVTGSAVCYRFLPSMVFEKNLTLTMPFDKEQVSSEDDLVNLYTYFYNESRGYWQRLEKTGVDESQGTITSVTNHFTDMINSTLKLPESPGPLSFNPNSIKDIQAAHPLQNIPGIDGLQANPFGSANFSLPFTLPPGRRGMMPQVGLSYNSSAGNGWLGKGFSITTPSITIETKFGLPDYDGSEQYLLNGEELIALNTPGRYRQRVEKGYEKIERLGDSVSNYSFKVTSKDGTVQYFGTDGAALKSNRGANAVYIWYLSKVVDLRGNTIVYHYVEENIGDGRELYLSEIRYTGFDDEEGHYRVTFESEGRDDVIVECRGKFVHQTEKRLKNVKVWYDDTLIRRYQLDYEYIMGKSSLVKASEFDSKDNLFYDYDFEYYELDGAGDGYNGFGAPETFSGNMELTLENNLSFGGGGSFYTGVGPGYDYSGFDYSGGMNVGFDIDYSYDNVKFIDINGDGLSDQVTQETLNGPLKCRLNNGNGFDAPVYLDGVDRQFNGSLQTGFSIGASGGFGPFSGSLGGSFSWTNGLSSFTDMDGDGFIDFIPRASTNWYYRGSENGFSEKGYFTSTTETVSVPGGDSSAEDEIRASFHLVDPVKKWKPGYSGTVIVRGEARKMEEGGDGVRADYYLNSARLGGAKLTDSDSTYNHNRTVAITPDDSLYFKVNSIKGIDHDQVLWTPEIVYSDIQFFENMKDAFNSLPKEINAGQYDEDLEPELGNDDITLFDAWYKLDENEDAEREDRYYHLTGEVDESSKEALMLVLKKGNLANPRYLDYGSSKKWVKGDGTTVFIDYEYQPKAENIANVMSPESTEMSTGTITGDGILIGRVKSDDVVTGRYWLKDDGAIVSLALEDVIGRTIDVLGTAEVAESAEDRENSFGVVRKEGALVVTYEMNGQKLIWSLLNDGDQVDTFSYLLKESVDAMTESEQETILKYYTIVLDSVSGDEIGYALNAGVKDEVLEEINEVLKVYSLIAYDQVSLKLVVSPERAFSVSETAWLPGMVEVGSTDDKAKEKTSYIEVSSLDEAGDLVSERVYLHVFNSKSDFSLESVEANYSVRVPESLDALEYDRNRLLLVDKSNDGGTYNENRTFYVSMYEADGDRYVLKSGRMDEVYHDGVTCGEKLTQLYYQLGYGSEYFSGGVYGWYYGEWNGAYNWDESLVGAVDESKGISYFNGAGSMTGDYSVEKDGVTTSNRIGKDMYYGTEFQYRSREPDENGEMIDVDKYFLSYMTDEIFVPSRKGGDSVEKLPVQVNSISLDRLSQIRGSFTKTFNYSTNIALFAFTGMLGDTTAYGDFFDINGDRYPDMIFQPIGSVLRAVTNYKGKGFKGSVSYNTFDQLRYTWTDSLGWGATFSPAMKDGWMTTKNDPVGKVKGVYFSSPQASFSGGAKGTLGTSNTQVDWADMNGDGLIDQIRRKNSGDFEVKLNVGDGFIDARWTSDSWDGVDVFTGGGISAAWRNPNQIRHVTSKGVNFNFSGGWQHASFNVSAGISASETKIDLFDINGDDLPDQVIKFDGQPFMIRLNLGNRFGDVMEWYTGGDWLKDQEVIAVLDDTLDELAEQNGCENATMPSLSSSVDMGSQSHLKEDWTPLHIGDVISYSGTLNISTGGSATIPIGFYPVPITVYLTPEGHFAFAMSSAQLMMTDIDGDGLPDHVLKKMKDGTVKVKKNLSKRVGLLKNIKTPAGGGVLLEYDATKNSVDMPNSQWVLSGVTRYEGGGDKYRTTYDYRDSGYYDRDERAFYGYSYVKTTGVDGSYVVQNYLNSSYEAKGLLSAHEGYGSDGKRYSSSQNEYEFNTVVSGVKNVVAVLMRETFSTNYDPVTGNSLITGESYEYDSYGNVTSCVSKGDLESSDDDVYIDVEYEYQSAGYVMGLPLKLTARNARGSILRQKSGKYNSYGEMTELEENLDGGTNPVTSLVYDKYGNLKSVTDQSGYTVSYIYDEELHSYPVSTEDSWGYRSSADYDYKLGADISTVDVNGQRMRKEYDSYGRLTAVYTSYDTTLPAVGFEYYPDEKRAVTHNKVSYNSSDDKVIDTVTIVDGLGRVLQTKKTGELTKDGKTVTGMNVSGKVVYDSMGRVIQQGMGGFQSAEDAESAELYQYYDIGLIRPTSMTYDAIGRVKENVLPDGSIISYDYRIEDGRFKNTVTDPNGKRKVSYSNIKEEIEQIDQWNYGVKISTRYEYSVLGEIEKVIDADGNETKIAYDSLGRRISIDNPDAGLIEFKYDANGNLAEKITPNLRANGQRIKYEYEYHRLKKVDYPEMEDVNYEYGSADDVDNRAGRLIKVVDGSGEREFSYGALGQVIKKKYALKVLNPAVTELQEYEELITTNYLGQIEQMTYADGEVLSYEYNSGGQVTSVKGEHYGETFTYIETIGYDEMGQRSYIKYGNGVETNYTYDENRRWLSNIHTKNSNGDVFQDCNYDFDRVGNILSVENKGYKWSKQSYSYDDLYQLTEANGQYIDRTLQALPKTYTYKQQYRYDNIGNMTRKISERYAKPNNSNPPLMNYDYSYTYSDEKPHQATKIGQWSIKYDLNGNMIEKNSLNTASGSSEGNFMENDTVNGVIDGNIMENDSNSTGESGVIDGNITDDTDLSETDSAISALYNEENRLTRYENNRGKTYYLYNVDGIATVERSESTGETLFISQYMNLKNDNVFTKHIYVGSTRVASKLGNKGYGSIDTGYEQKNTYYVHSDHLGSANWITDYKGNEYRHYMSSPYGETFVEEGDALDKIGYAFTGQRESKSTGLTMFQFRFYDAVLSRWTSVDPALLTGEYLPTGDKQKDSSLPGVGGVFNAVNLNSYHYAGNNPMNYIDPDGRFAFKINKFKAQKQRQELANRVPLGNNTNAYWSLYTYGCYVTAMTNILNTFKQSKYQKGGGKTYSIFDTNGINSAFKEGDGHLIRPMDILNINKYVESLDLKSKTITRNQYSEYFDNNDQGYFMVGLEYITLPNGTKSTHFFNIIGKPDENGNVLCYDGWKRKDPYVTKNIDDIAQIRLYYQDKNLTEQIESLDYLPPSDQSTITNNSN